MDPILLAALVLVVLAGLLFAYYKAAEENRIKYARINRTIPDNLFSSRTTSTLKSHGIKELKTVAQLRKEDLMKLPQIGEKRANEIKEKISQLEEGDLYVYRRITGSYCPGEGGKGYDPDEDREIYIVY